MKIKLCQRGQWCDRPKTGRCRKHAKWKTPKGMGKTYFWCDEHRNYYDVTWRQNESSSPTAADGNGEAQDR
jgi:hypothetical protein